MTYPAPNPTTETRTTTLALTTHVRSVGLMTLKKGAVVEYSASLSSAEEEDVRFFFVARAGRD
jgi:hypothetical protein